MNKLLFILALLLLPLVQKAQTKLASGDIAFIAINSDEGVDDFSFVLLRNINSGTSIFFTDNGWTAAGAFNSVYTESHITWTAYEKMQAGTVIQIKTYNGNKPALASDGKISGDKMTVSVAGDQILAYQGNKAEPRFIAAISFNQNINTEPGDNFDGDSYSNSTTAMPPGLAKGVSAIHIYLPEKYKEGDNSIYNCSVASGDKEELLYAINNVNNWVLDDDVAFKQNPFPCEFKVELSTDIKEIRDAKYKIFPNPASNYIRVVAESTRDARIKIINTAGMMMDAYFYPAYTKEQTFSIHHLPRGIYYVKIRTNDEEFTTVVSVVK
ncbi:Por secretion system C-terminal sorting domain-containing protein [Saccharicrinis carchari]|uniref:Por secretion system C-terminal sorting domain-containing protein n=1 Tax=Saccharicrinis carchari TaxID=1168039 RepID=A0A521C1Z3_SACCC|nr:T9SS type A sorting domain-containing protein [Saccharicrinis carchari]SMO53414.1 Por secretion system C-terminal sorting domain-containing protein [Saccharicrinis carchari]